MDPTVTVDSTSSPAPVWARHDTVLTDTHDRHAHIVVPKDDVAVKSWLPKLRPSTLTQYPPEVGALADENDHVTGAAFNRPWAIGKGKLTRMKDLVRKAVTMHAPESS